MLSREDYNNYLKQIGDIEKDMVRVYGTCVNLSADDEVKRVCSKLLEQEREHADLVKELMRLFAAYT